VKRSFGISILVQTLVLIAAISLWGSLCCATESSPAPEIPVKGKITMVGFGHSGCLGCWLQGPTMRSIEKKYRDSDEVAIIYIDTKAQAGQVAKYQIQEVPAQIFFDKDGKEVYRHTGQMFEGAIVSRLTKMGARQ